MTSPRDLAAILDRAAAHAPELVGQGHNANGNGTPPWPDPLPLETKRTLPGLPLDQFPLVLADFIRCVAVDTQTPCEMAAFQAIAALSAVALPLGPVHVRDSWREELPFYGAVILPSGERKSPVTAHARRPLNELERERRRDQAPQIAQDRAAGRALKAQRKRLENKLERETDPLELRQLQDDLAVIEGKIAEHREPHEPRILADDATAESIARLLTEHGTIAAISAEAALLDNLLGRYSEGAQANLHLVCQAYDGEHTTVDRRLGDPLVLDRPLLTIGLAVQPLFLDKMRRNETAMAQGFIARFWFALPASTLGHRDQEPPGITELVSSEYRELIKWVGGVEKSLLRDPVTTGDKTSSEGVLSPVVTGSERQGFRLSLEAREVLLALRTRLEPQFRDGGALGSPAARAWGSKHAGRCVRLAAYFHLAEMRPPQTPIAAESMAAAIAVGDALIPHALEAIDASGEAELAPLLSKAVSWIRGHKLAMLTARDLQRGPYVFKESSARCELVLGRLCELGYLRRRETIRPDGFGRPPSSPAFDVHPAVASESDT